MTTITTLPSVDFQRLCRDMSNIGTDIEIKRSGININFNVMVTLQIKKHLLMP